MNFTAKDALNELYILKRENGDINELFDFYVDPDVDKLLDYLYEHKLDREAEEERKLKYPSLSEYGKRYKVLKDEDNCFTIGEIVVALEEGAPNPFCVREKCFYDGATEDVYSSRDCRALAINEDIEILKTIKEDLDEEAEEYMEEEDMEDSFSIMAKQGQRYRIITDTDDFFDKGDIVVSLENVTSIPYCVKEDVYIEGATPEEYPAYQKHAIVLGLEAEEIKSQKSMSGVDISNAMLLR